MTVPTHLHHVVMRSHSAQTFVAFLTDVVGMEVQIPGVDLFFCTMGGVPMEFMGAYAPEANSGTSEATKS